jgi:hypothetical protein
MPVSKSSEMEMPNALATFSSVLTDGFIDVKTSSRRSRRRSRAIMLSSSLLIRRSWASTAILGKACSGETRVDALVATKDPQLVQIDPTPGESGRKLVEKMYPLVAEGINNGLFIPNHASTLCSWCPSKPDCAEEFGGVIE